MALLAYEKGVLSEIFIADTFFKRFLGYMFRKKPHHEAILIKPCNSIHTFFMKFSIDVLFLDENMLVVKKIENLKPRKIIMPLRNSELVVESGAGNFKEVEEGQKLVVMH